MNRIILHLEGLTVFGLCIYVYGHHQFSWLLFIILLLLPDFSMLGYFVNKQAGAVVYNLFHTYIITIPVIIIGFLLSKDLIIAFGLIWTAHIGMDRMLGYGLKYETDFNDTHLKHV